MMIYNIVLFLRILLIFPLRFFYSGLVKSQEGGMDKYEMKRRPYASVILLDMWRQETEWFTSNQWTPNMSRWRCRDSIKLLSQDQNLMMEEWRSDLAPSNEGISAFFFLSGFFTFSFPRDLVPPFFLFFFISFLASFYFLPSFIPLFCFLPSFIASFPLFFFSFCSFLRFFICFFLPLLTSFLLLFHLFLSFIA